MGHGPISVTPQSGVTVDTLRLYERQGLLPPATRGASNYRDLPPVTIGRLKFIRGAQELGFTWAEIREILRVRTNPVTSCQALRERARTIVVELEERIRRLRRVKNAWIKVLRDCEARLRALPCQITQSLASLWRGKESSHA